MQQQTLYSALEMISADHSILKSKRDCPIKTANLLRCYKKRWVKTFLGSMIVWVDRIFFFFLNNEELVERILKTFIVNMVLRCIVMRAPTIQVEALTHCLIVERKSKKMLVVVHLIIEFKSYNNWKNPPRKSQERISNSTPN